MYKKILRRFLIENDIELTDLEKSLIKHEGFKPKYYFCKKIKHFGIGRNAEANKLSNKQNMIVCLGSTQQRVGLALKLLEEDIRTACNGVYRVFKDQFATFTRAQDNALIEMIFQMGIGSFKGNSKKKGFKKTIDFIKFGLWENARVEALDSEWARKFPKRANEVVAGFIL